MTTQSTEDNLHDGEWVKARLIEHRRNPEQRLRALDERNAELRVEIMQYAMRLHLR